MDLSRAMNEGQTDPDSSFVGQLNDKSFIAIVDTARANELGNRLAARIKQSVNFFYPAKERTASGERPPLTFELGLLTSQNGPFATSEMLKAAGLKLMQPL